MSNVPQSVGRTEGAAARPATVKFRMRWSVITEVGRAAAGTVWNRCRHLAVTELCTVHITAQSRVLLTALVPGGPVRCSFHFSPHHLSFQFFFVANYLCHKVLWSRLFGGWLVGSFIRSLRSLRFLE